VQPDALGVTIASALGQVCDVLDADHAYVVATEPQTLAVGVLEEWWRPGVEQVVATPVFELPVEAQRFWARRLRKGEAVAIDDVHEMPPDGAEAGADLIKGRVLSILLVPLTSSHGAVGFIGFEARQKHHTWVEDEIALVRTVGEMLVITIDRCRAETALQQAVADLAQRNRDLERSNRDLEQFASIVSHDLKSPLMLIEGYVDLLAAAIGNPSEVDSAPQYAAAARRGVERMARLIDDLLAYARAGAGLADPETVSLDDVIGDVIADLGSVIASSGGEVHVGPLPSIEGDRSQLRQLFQNLIANALKFHRPETSPHVDVSASTQDGRCQVVVADDGIGIASGRRQEVFEMFNRGADSSAPGTGIGLAIAARVAANHRGRVWIEDNPGGGTRVNVSLPCVPQHS
jgi:signal transduction histidine kinase